MKSAEGIPYPDEPDTAVMLEVLDLELDVFWQAFEDSDPATQGKEPILEDRILQAAQEAGRNMLWNVKNALKLADRDIDRSEMSLNVARSKELARLVTRRPPRVELTEEEVRAVHRASSLAYTLSNVNPNNVPYPQYRQPENALVKRVFDNAMFTDATGNQRKYTDLEPDALDQLAYEALLHDDPRFAYNLRQLAPMCGQDLIDPLAEDYVMLAARLMRLKIRVYQDYVRVHGQVGHQQNPPAAA